MEYSEVLQKSRLFDGIDERGIAMLIKCLGAEYKEYEKNDTILWEGNSLTKVGIVLSGNVRSVKTNVSGKSIIVSLIEEGSYIGILLAASLGRKSPVTLEAQESLKILFFSTDKILGVCDKSCPEHIRLFRNFLDATAEKALDLYDRIDCLTQPTVREKVITYLSKAAQKQGTRMFMIPLNRSALADYLNVERSSLSRELSNMKKDGIIDFFSNTFKLL